MSGCWHPSRWELKEWLEYDVICPTLPLTASNGEHVVSYPLSRHISGMTSLQPKLLPEEWRNSAPEGVIEVAWHGAANLFIARQRNENSGLRKRIHSQQYAIRCSIRFKCNEIQVLICDNEKNLEPVHWVICCVRNRTTRDARWNVHRSRHFRTLPHSRWMFRSVSRLQNVRSLHASLMSATERDVCSTWLVYLHACYAMSHLATDSCLRHRALKNVALSRHAFHDVSLWRIRLPRASCWCRPTFAGVSDVNRSVLFIRSSGEWWSKCW